MRSAQPDPFTSSPSSPSLKDLYGLTLDEDVGYGSLAGKSLQVSLDRFSFLTHQVETERRKVSSTRFVLPLFPSLFHRYYSLEVLEVLPLRDINLGDGFSGLLGVGAPALPKENDVFRGDGAVDELLGGGRHGG